MAERSARRRGWWRIGLGAAYLGVAGWSWATRAGVLMAGHPAQSITIGALGVLGAVLLMVGLRDAMSRRDLTERPTWLAIVGRGLSLLITVAVVGAMIYLRPFSASPGAIDALRGDSAVSVENASTRITVTPTNGEYTTGLIFQPGARVDPRAYVPILSDLAEQGYLVVIVKQPFDIGFAAVNDPAGVIEDHPEIDQWAVGGHSLGGVAASTSAEDRDSGIAGLLLWASYPLGSLADTDVVVTSVSATEDGLATPSDIEASRVDLPADTTYVPVEGAVHAFFGDYGEQPGDGMPTVTRAQAQQQIVDASVELLRSLSSATTAP